MQLTLLSTRFINIQFKLHGNKLKRQFKVNGIFAIKLCIIYQFLNQIAFSFLGSRQWIFKIKNRKKKKKVKDECDLNVRYRSLSEAVGFARQQRRFPDDGRHVTRGAVLRRRKKFIKFNCQGRRQGNGAFDWNHRHDGTCKRTINYFVGFNISTLLVY